MSHDVLFSTTQFAVLASSCEVPGVISDSISTLADILLPTLYQSHCTALDVHLVSPLQLHTLHEATSTLAIPIGRFPTQVCISLQLITVALGVGTSEHSQFS